MHDDRRQGRGDPTTAAGSAPSGASGRERASAGLGPALHALLSAPPQDASAQLEAILGSSAVLDTGAIVVRDGSGWRVAARAGVGAGAPPRPGVPIRALGSWAPGEPAGVVLPGDLTPGLLAHDTRAACAAPIEGRAGDEVGGVVLLGTRSTDALGEDEILLARAVADRVGRHVEVAALTAALERAQQAAGRTGAFRDHILAIVGHDLRNPLGAIFMSAALLRKRGGLEGWQAKTVDRVHGSAARMGRIIDDLLSYTRTRLGGGIPIARALADLRDIAGRMIDELRAAHPEATVEVDAEGDLTGQWDGARLEQVLSNLVSNAIDHGEDDHPVRVRLRGSGETVSLEVENRGEMPRATLEHAFEAFHRGPDEAGKKASGLGLGLFIAREIVRRHDGDIRVGCAEGWTRIAVQLPRHHRTVLAPSPEPSAERRD